MRINTIGTLAGCLLLLATAVGAETVEEVLAKHVAARGGRTAWDAVEDIELRGSYTSFSKIEPFVWQRARGHRMRFETKMSGHPITMACDGDTYWMVHDFYEIGWPVRMFPQDRVHESQDNELASTLFHVAEDGWSAELLSDAEVDGTPAIGIKLTRGDGEEETWFLDPQSYLEIARESVGSDFGQAVPRRTYYDDFREVSGVKIPFLVESEFYTRHRIAEVEEAIVNGGVDAARFAFPTPPGMDRLAALAGEWAVKVEERQSPRAPWEESERTVTIEPLARGSMLLERYTGTDGVENVRTISYDQFRKVYRLAQIDDFSSYLNVLEGQFDEGGKLTVDNVATDSAWTGFGQTFHARAAILDIAADSFRIEEESSTDGGESWNLVTKLTYSRLTPAPE